MKFFFRSNQTEFNVSKTVFTFVLSECIPTAEKKKQCLSTVRTYSTAPWVTYQHKRIVNKLTACCNVDATTWTSVLRFSAPFRASYTRRVHPSRKIPGGDRQLGNGCGHVAAAIVLPETNRTKKIVNANRWEIPFYSDMRVRVGCYSTRWIVARVLCAWRASKRRFNVFVCASWIFRVH